MRMQFSRFFQQFAPNVHCLLQAALTFQLVVFVMGFSTFVWQLETLPVREDLDVRGSPGLKLAGAAIVAASVFAIWIFR